MKRILNSHPALWVLLSIPAASLVWRYVAGDLSYGEILHETGVWSVELLILVLAVTPIRLLWRRYGWTQWLAQRRRDLGVATFAYAALHTAIYLIRKADLALIAEESAAVELWTGWIAFVIFAALAATSNDASVRRLGRRWKALHRLVYLGAALTFAHWLLSAFDPTAGFVYLAILIVIEGGRLWLSRRRHKVT